jgi:NitT/TauT family transport system permease protein
MKNFKLGSNRTIIEITALASAIAVWWLLSILLASRVLPSPPVVFDYVVQDIVSGNALFHIYSTLVRVVVGFLLSLAIGISLGILMGIRKIWEGYFATWVMVGLAFPDILWPILGIVWFGLSDSVAYLSIVMIVFPIVTVHIWEGVKAVDKSLVDMSKAFRVSKLRTIRNVYIPMLMPHILSTMRFAFATSWKIVTIAEVFGLSNGVGYMLAYWYHEFYTAQVFAWALIFVVIMIFIERFIFDRISKRAFKWRPETKL